MNPTIVLANQVNGILSGFIKVHEDILKPSLRKVIPIPGIFKPIDFDAHKATLSQLESQIIIHQQQLASLLHSHPEHSVFLETLREYMGALTSSIEKLGFLSAALSRKATGREYSQSEYNQDLEIYRASVQNYMGIGDRLNSLMATVVNK